MLICERGDIAVVPFPFTDSAATKKRPALVLSDRTFNAAHGHTIFAMITSATHSSWPSDLPVAADPTTGLSHPSIIRWKLFTLPNAIIIRKAGVLDKFALANAAESLQTVLGFSHQSTA